ncbi:guanosine-5'-triphosphate,3'-diphosphate diphosphatase [Thaumasiovibrio subtropicus]|uniref:guanosine-5'-triphosphate,3'-diphosphate diphosphatase n=1 Tax=Thaumasiovibrio subtropicus TaxID=1891207 RepID=UPI000B35BEAA|nr:guanosine-5'-triphosphate,3'-diphosphate diphosphatase [Thaumasiovibrio subtropicus]
MTKTVSPIYAAIDLGSNSFHMWLIRNNAGSVQTLAKIKRKVRLAAGLDSENNLSQEAMQRGWDCLSLFAERLQDIEPTHIRIVGTAALRRAINAKHFLDKAAAILGHTVEVIPGEEEARIIYQGVAHTSGGSGRRLVVDIGGASTEMIIGSQFDAKALQSLHMGCVTWLEQYFADRSLTQANFDAAINAAKAVLAPIKAQYLALGWDVCVGASGTVQALQEIMLAQGMSETITLKKLKRMQAQAMHYEQLEELDIEGLTLERALVFPSGLSILIAIFESFGIESMTLAGGALREGLAYEMMAGLRQDDICQRTLTSVQARFQLDTAQASLVALVANTLLGQLSLDAEESAEIAPLLHACCAMHEIGISLGFKQASSHSAYLLKSLELPGFTRAQKYLIAAIIERSTGTLPKRLDQQAISENGANTLLRILRLAIILCHRRQPEALLSYQLENDSQQWRLNLPAQWRDAHPLLAADLCLEATRQSDAGLCLSLSNA